MATIVLPVHEQPHQYHGERDTAIRITIIASCKAAAPVLTGQGLAKQLSEGRHEGRDDADNNERNVTCDT